LPFITIQTPEPPADIWPDPKVRFSPQACWTRINQAIVWLVPKQRVLHTAAASLAILAASATLIACQSGMDGDFDPKSILFIIGAIVAMLSLLARQAKRHSQPAKQSKDSHSSSGCTSGYSSGCGGYASPSHHSSSDQS
jgi:hypothetical protein